VLSRTVPDRLSGGEPASPGLPPAIGEHRRIVLTSIVNKTGTFQGTAFAVVQLMGDYLYSGERRSASRLAARPLAWRQSTMRHVCRPA
jgi:hypothetical protein